MLIWEYPRGALSGEQAGLVESMDINDDGLITEHCVYWGWRGVCALIDKRAKAAAPRNDALSGKARLGHSQ